MRRFTAILVLSALLLAAGCGSAKDNTSAPQSAEPEASATQSQSQSEPEPEQEAPEGSAEEERDVGEPQTDDPFEGLTQDEYEGLEITAAVLPRMAILPGSAIPVTVTVANNGDKTVAYTQGSGVFETPEALVVQFDGLQPVIPKDNLGPVTMDFVTKELAPGESLQYQVQVLAVEPSDQFDTYTYDLYNKDQTYIAEMEWPALQELHPDLTAAQAASYTGTVSFRYTLVQDEGVDTPAGLFGPTGYNRAELVVSVNA